MNCTCKPDPYACSRSRYRLSLASHRTPMTDEQYQQARTKYDAEVARRHAAFIEARGSDRFGPRHWYTEHLWGLFRDLQRTGGPRRC